MTSKAIPLMPAESLKSPNTKFCKALRRTWSPLLPTLFFSRLAFTANKDMESDLTSATPDSFIADCSAPPIPNMLGNVGIMEYCNDGCP